MNRLERFMVAVSLLGFVSFVVDAIIRPSVVLVSLAAAVWTIANLFGILTASTWRRRAER